MCVYFTRFHLDHKLLDEQEDEFVSCIHSISDKPRTV